MYLFFGRIIPATQVIDVIYYYVIRTDNGSTLSEANTRRQERKYPMMKVLWGCILKLSLHSVNSVSILYRTGNMQSAILLSFDAFSFLPPCGLQSTHLPMPCYISPYVVYSVYGLGGFSRWGRGNSHRKPSLVTQHLPFETHQQPLNGTHHVYAFVVVHQNNSLQQKAWSFLLNGFSQAMQSVKIVVFFSAYSTQIILQ